MKSKLFYSVGSKSETGISNEHNTDALLDFPILDGYILTLADGHNGIGGYGALASKMAVESIRKYFYNRSYQEIEKALTNAFTYANYSIYEQTQKDVKYEGFGSTLAVMIVRSDKIYYAYAGDSRIYWLRNHELQPLTRDHVSNLQDISNSEVTTLLGKNKDIRFGVSKNPILAQEGDLFMLCTDGLTDVIPEEEILDILNDGNTSPEHKCFLLTESVRTKKGTGDTSIQIIEFSAVAEPTAKTTKKSMRYFLTILFAAFMILVAGYAGYLLYAKYVNQPVRGDEPQVISDNEIKSGTTEMDYPVEKSTLNDESDESISKPIANDPPKDQKIGKKESTIQNNTTKKESKKVSDVSTVNTKSTDKKTTKPSSTPESTKSNGKLWQHKILPGENLYRISLRYHVTQKQLIDINGQIATNFIAGQELKIPVTAIHKVTSGDTFKGISSKYNVPIQLILNANSMNESSTLKTGINLIIPLP